MRSVLNSIDQRLRCEIAGGKTYWKEIHTDRKGIAKLTSPWQFRPIGVFSGKKYNRRLANRHCSFLSRHTIRSSAIHAIGESDHGRTGMQSPSASTNGFL